VHRGRVLPEAGSGGDPQDPAIEAIIEVPESVTSQSRHSLVLRGSPPHGKLVIPLEPAPQRGCRAGDPAGEMSEWLKEHAWKLLWPFATACYRFRLPLRSQPLSRDRVYSVDRCKPQ
jgi:hypothetical protein